MCILMLYDDDIHPLACGPVLLDSPMLYDDIRPLTCGPVLLDSPMPLTGKGEGSSQL